MPADAQAEPQVTQRVLMVEPCQFAFNPETAATNAFVHEVGTLSAATVQNLALAEFRSLVARLREHGIEVSVIDGRHAFETPDAVFPNNWFSTHASGELVLYPMAAPTRRAERRADVIEAIDRMRSGALSARRRVDLVAFEERVQYLEGTGSLVLDRTSRVAYAAYSARTHAEPLREWARELDYRVVAFGAFDPTGRSVYHTNVILSVGRKLAVACLEAIPERAERERIVASLAASGHRLLEISWAQAVQFCGNVLELRGPRGKPVWAMSQSARSAFTSEQLLEFEREEGAIVSSPIPVLETLGGGSVRCMIAEIF